LITAELVVLVIGVVLRICVVTIMLLFAVLLLVSVELSTVQILATMCLVLTIGVTRNVAVSTLGWMVSAAATALVGSSNRVVAVSIADTSLIVFSFWGAVMNGLG
jgi:hypothetical protein